MRHHLFNAIILTVLSLTMGSCNDTVYDELPSSVQSFISQYFPFGEVGSYTETDSGDFTVAMKNGATITFGKEYTWVDINGNGLPLSDMILYDLLPSALYSYLLETEHTADVFRLTRSATGIKVELHDTFFIYEMKSEKITYPTAP